MTVVLGIETSCDETSVALVQSDKTILAHLVSSQIDEHQMYGGVVPEVAARAHLRVLPALLKQLFNQTDLVPNQVDVIAATTGPGLIGGVVVGAMAAKAMAAALDKPFVAVNHLEGHALTARLTSNVDFPFILLLVSGGHCQVMRVDGVGQYQLLGSTLDDAVGECFDKVAKMLHLPYPGGPEIEKCAVHGSPSVYELPRPMVGHKSLNFSFSGLKTATRRLIEDLREKHGGILPQQVIADVCASFQTSASKALSDRVLRALKQFPDVQNFVVAGGVAANKVVRHSLEQVCAKTETRFFAPPLKLCTDNGAMIAWAGWERYRLGLVDSLNVRPRPRWPLSEVKRSIA